MLEFMAEVHWLLSDFTGAQDNMYSNIWFHSKINTAQSLPHLLEQNE